MSDKKLFRSPYGTYLHAHNDQVTAAENPGPHSHFHLEWIGGDTVALQAHGGKYIAVGSDGVLYTSENLDHDSKFLYERSDDGRVAFKNNHHNRYLGVDGSGGARGHHSIQDGELFYEETVGY